MYWIKTISVNSLYLRFVAAGAPVEKDVGNAQRAPAHYKNASAVAPAVQRLEEILERYGNERPRQTKEADL